MGIERRQHNQLLKDELTILHPFSYWKGQWFIKTGRETSDRYDHRQQALLSRVLLSAWYMGIEFHTMQHLSRGPTALWRGVQKWAMIRYKTNQREELLYHDSILHWGFKRGKKDDSFNKGIPLSLSRFRVYSETVIFSFKNQFSYFGTFQVVILLLFM